MPNQTPNYNLVKPLTTENYDVNIFNGNADIIDSTLKNIDTQLNDKVNKTSIINNCNATEEGFVLDATQGKILDDLINEYMSKIINYGEFDGFTDKVSDMLNGAFSVSLLEGLGTAITNCPVNSPERLWFNVITIGTINRCNQIALQSYTNSYAGCIWTRSQHDENVSPWKQIILQ